MNPCRFSRSLVIVSGLSALVCSVTAADRIVGKNGYPSFAAAVAAANPGDRILLTRNASITGALTINKALTIASLSGGPRRTLFTEHFGGQYQGVFKINAAVTFRHIRLLIMDPADSASPANGIEIKTTTGSVVFDRVQVDVKHASGALLALVDVAAPSLLMRQVKFNAPDLKGTYNGIGYKPNGASCLRAMGTSLVLEDCVLRAGSGASVTINAPSAGAGGTALVENTAITVLVRTRLSDGNGSHVVTSSGPKNPTPAGASKFTGFLYDVTHEAGLPGLHMSLPNRGPVLRLGESQAPLRTSGGQIGGSLSLSFDPPTDPSFKGLGYVVGLDLISVPIGSFRQLFTNPLITQLSWTGPHSLKIPAIQSLVGIVVTSQSILASPLRLGNPSFIQIQR